MWDDEIKQAPDGTFTVCLAPWSATLIEGIPTKALAELICTVAYEAMRSYTDNAMTD